MCGRFTLAKPPEAVAKAFSLSGVPDFPPRYNIAPSQPVGVILQDRDSGRRDFRLMRWGLIPSWAKDPQKMNFINARAETVAEKASFRSAFQSRRCLIPADGFFEWQKQSARAKQPFYVALKDGGLFAFVGLWESWQDIETCTILTTASNSLMQPIHDRMPVILSPEKYDYWLNANIHDIEKLTELLGPFNAERMQVSAVSTRVNSATVDDVQCIEPLPKP